MSTGQSSTVDLVQLLSLEQLAADRFRADCGPGDHVFGGQVLGQAIVAAARTVDERSLHSLHAYFLLRGNPRQPIDFAVDRIRDGRSFTTRLVVGSQGEAAIFHMAASFQLAELGLEHQAAMPAVPAPDELPSDELLLAELPGIERYAFRYRSIDSRQVEGLHMIPRRPRPALAPRKRTWMRIKQRLPDDPAVHAALLAYMSDMDFMSTAMLPHGPALRRQRLQGASLDHALWFHRPCRADDWLLFVKESPLAAAARGFVRGCFYTTSGQLVASTAQECLLRLRPRQEADSEH